MVAFIILLVGRGLYRLVDSRTQAQVEKIHATKLTLADVMGENLPPVPENPDVTVAGVDANANGIRDDVELAIFKEYPDSAKTRAVLLQYALALQMEVTQPALNAEIVEAIEEQKSRGHLCIGKVVSRDDMTKFIATTDHLRTFVESRELNTESRVAAQEKFYNKLKSGEIPSFNLCDIDLGILVD